MNVLFINAINPQSAVEQRFAPLGIGYLCAMLRQRFGSDEVRCRVVNDGRDLLSVQSEIDLVCISAVSQNFDRAKAYALDAKRRGLPVLVGGVHISMVPESLDRSMDVGVVGEGESAICELVDVYMRTGSFSAAQLRAIKGIVFYDETGCLVQTERRPLIEDMDTIPLPARDLLHIDSETYMFTSRGCPYRCEFCASSRFWSKVRFFSAEYVFKEICVLQKEYGVTKITFYDDLFVLDEQRLKRLVELLEGNPATRGLSFSCSLRANIVTDELIKTLKRMHVTEINMGLESGSEKVLKYLKHNVTLADNKKAVDIVVKHGVRVGGTFVIGSPDETLADVVKTFFFIARSPLYGFYVYILTPFPGTPVWSHAVSEGLIKKDFSWDQLDVEYVRNWRKAIVVSRCFCREQLLFLYGIFAALRYARLALRAVFHPWLAIRYGGRIATRVVLRVLKRS